MNVLQPVRWSGTRQRCNKKRPTHEGWPFAVRQIDGSKSTVTESNQVANEFGRLQVRCRVGLDVSHHVEVVVVDVDHLDCLAIMKRVRYRIADGGSLVEVNR